MKKRCEWVFAHVKKLKLLFPTLNMVGLACCLLLSLEGFSQEKRFTFQMKQVAVADVFLYLEKNSDYSFVYNPENLQAIGLRDYDFRDAGVADIMTECLKESGLVYEITNRHVIIREAAYIHQMGKTSRISGVVVDAEDNPLPGVTVLLKGTNLGVTSDMQGYFRMIFPEIENPVLVFSFIGMKKQEVACQHGDYLRIRMEEEVRTIEEVVVTGYQTMRKQDVVGSVSVLKTDDIMMPAYSSIDQMLQGRVPGMVVMNTSSRVGTTPKIRVRGTSTILGNQDPLWVVDGIIQPDPIAIDQSNMMVDDLKTILGNQISWLNPSDIESVTVLKDASATAIYGSKAANGVIVITTKRGVADRLTVNYSGNFSFRARPTYKQFNLMDSHERIAFSREAFAAGAVYETAPIASMDTYEGIMALYMSRQISQSQAEDGIYKLETANTDWMKLLLRNSFSHHHNLSFSGGTKRVFYNASLSYNDDGGIEKGNDSRNMSGRLRLGAELHPKVYMDFSIIGSMGENNGYAAGVNPMAYAQSTSRAVRAFDDEGGLLYLKQQTRYKLNTYPVDLSYNIFNEIDNSYSKSKSTHVSSTFNFKWDVLSWLKYEFVGGLNRNITQSESYAGEKTNYIARQYRGYDYGTETNDSEKFKAAILPFGGELFTNDLEVTGWNVQNKLNIEKTFLEEHRLNIMLGMEAVSTKNQSHSNTQWGYSPERGEKLIPPTPIQDLIFIGGGSALNVLDPMGVFQKLYNGEGAQRINYTNNSFSLFATLAYSYKDRYVLNASIRNDESNRFGQDQNKRFDPTYSFGVSWRLAEEPWMEKVRSVLNQVNFRASYGIQGNTVTSIGPDLIASQGGVKNYFNEYYVTISRLPNPHLSWERTKSYNLGLDLQLLDGITFTAEYYHKRANNIVRQDIAWEYGLGSMEINGGRLTNSGMEYSLNITPIRNENWGWTIGLNSSKNWNKAGERSVDNLRVSDFLSGRSDRVLKEGYDLSSFWSYSFAGLHPENGFPTFNLLNDEEGNPVDFNGEYTDYLVYSGRTEPNFTGGITTRLRWKGLVFGANFSLLLGAKKRLPNPFPLLGADKSSLPDSQSNLNRKLLQRWKKRGDDKYTDIPAVFNGQSGEQFVNLPWNEARESMYELWGKSDALVVNGSFLRCQQLSLTWNVQQKWCSRYGLKSLSLTATVNNPFVICSKRFDGFDPELVESVQPKIYNIGINIGL